METLRLSNVYFTAVNSQAQYFKSNQGPLRHGVIVHYHLDLGVGDAVVTYR